MLALSRSTLSTCISKSLCRSFAQVVPATQGALTPVPVNQENLFEGSTPSPRKTAKVPVREDHGLYAFFRGKEGDNLEGEARYEVFETPEQAQLVSGRAWRAEELRNKSFRDLHTLWYVALREKNLLATQKEEVRRMGVTNPDLQVSAEKVRQVRKTMARIKAVLNERRLAYQGAVEIAQREQANRERKAHARQYTESDELVYHYLTEGSSPQASKPSKDSGNTSTPMSEQPPQSSEPA
ncbi:mitochondrial 39-S ribosomal protein L47 (MRP-L47)-domain-containing protein [Panaeolus papilionaceus]|nr:mitochondrial 39-S ribosomal protein L47 (MRP-L47)-domain-containing protein [Panaeolus papilionaceus]